jgi:hypothetical protein
VKFQRTRGVLRLMAAVIHSLWEKGDRNPLILPGNVAIDDARVQSELTRYLSDNWVPVIEKDVDGPNSLPLKLDRDLPNLGRVSACRRVARAIYMGSAPTTAAAHKGIEDRRVKLGCAMPGESPAVFGDALRRMAGAATYLYQDGPHYWYSTQPTVTKLAEDRAEQFKRNPDKVAQEIEQRLRKDLERKGDFARIHPMPATGADVPDDLDARLVVLGVNHPYSREGNSAGEVAARAILESRGNARPPVPEHAGLPGGGQDPPAGPRRSGTQVPGVGVDPRREGAAQPDALSGHPGRDAEDRGRWHGHRQAAGNLSMAAGAGAGTPQAPITWEALRLSGAEALAVRASKKLRSDELYLTSFAPPACAWNSTACRSGAAIMWR